MKIYLFYHSIVSDWNHGNAHFLRGMVSALLEDNHDVTVYEPLGGWSYTNMIADAGATPAREYYERFPEHKVIFYDDTKFNPDILNDADMVIVHEWNRPVLISSIGNHRKNKGKYVLLFHDTHHRALTDPKMKNNDLSGYDGVLAFGEIIRDIYLKRKWAKNAWTLHEAADTTIFYPHFAQNEGDLVWIGNWGDDERTTELHEFLIQPVRELGLKATVYGVRYPREAIRALQNANIRYGGWIPNYKVPETFAKYRVTVHVPRRPYAEQLPGIPTIRPFEALSCGIPLISAPWNDTENLFRKNKDYLMVENGDEMKKALKKVLSSPSFKDGLIKSGIETIQKSHTCKHRKDQLLQIYKEIRMKEIEKSFRSAGKHSLKPLHESEEIKKLTGKTSSALEI